MAGGLGARRLLPVLAYRNDNLGSQTATCPVREPDRAPFAFNRLTRDREPQTSAAGSAIARCLKPLERFKDALKFTLRNSGSIIIDGYSHLRRGLVDCDPRGAAVE